MSNSVFLGQFCCVLAIVVWTVSIQNKKKENILYFQFLSNMLYGISYFILGITTGAIMDTLGGLRCFVFYCQTRKNKDKQISISWLFIFCIIAIICGIITYDGIISIIPTIICIFYTISSWMKDAKWLRIVFLLTAFLWLYYNITMGAYVAVGGNILEIISGTISIFRFNKKENRSEN